MPGRPRGVYLCVDLSDDQSHPDDSQEKPDGLDQPQVCFGARDFEKCAHAQNGPHTCDEKIYSLYQGNYMFHLFTTNKNNEGNDE